jgi:hypothetical protein
MAQEPIAFTPGQQQAAVVCASWLLCDWHLPSAGVGAASTDLRTMQLSGVAGLVAGALSMACGEPGSCFGADAAHYRSCSSTSTS